MEPVNVVLQRIINSAKEIIDGKIEFTGNFDEMLAAYRNKVNMYSAYIMQDAQDLLKGKQL